MARKVFQHVRGQLSGSRYVQVKSASVQVTFIYIIIGDPTPASLRAEPFQTFIRISNFRVEVYVIGSVYYL